MDFDYSCFGRPLNDVLINSVMNRKFYKILDKLSNHLHLSVYCILDVFNLMIVNVLFFSDVPFFQLHATFQLMPEIVQCSPLHSEVI